MTAPRDIVLVHGIADIKTAFDRLKARLAEEGFRPRSIDPGSRFGRERLEELASRLAAFVESELGTTDELSLIGFSMGGIVSRYYVQRLGGAERVHRLITISSPHHGTNTAWFLPFVGARQLRPGSDFLEDLNRDRAELERLRFLSIWTPWDLMVTPPNSSVLDVGESCRIPVPIHSLMTRDGRVIEKVVSALREDQAG